MTRNTYRKIAVRIDNFGHDLNGNGIARHTVLGYLNTTQPEDMASAELYQTKQRRQVGYAPNCDEFVQTAITKAGIDWRDLQFVHELGAREEGCIWHVFHTLPGK